MKTKTIPTKVLFLLPCMFIMLSMFLGGLVVNAFAAGETANKLDSVNK